MDGIEFVFNNQTVPILLFFVKTLCGIDLLSFNNLLCFILNPINRLVDGRAHGPIVTLWNVFRTSHGRHVRFYGSH